MVNRSPAVPNDFVSLRDVMDQFFSDNVASNPNRGIWSGGGSTGRMPLALDIYATKDEVVLIAAVPGLRPEDIEITINQNTVTLSGTIPNAAQAEDAKDATWYLHELGHGSFQRSITLPMDIDSTRAQATFENGILKLSVPKSEAAKPKRIEVQHVSQGQQSQSSQGQQGQSGQGQQSQTAQGTQAQSGQSQQAQAGQNRQPQTGQGQQSDHSQGKQSQTGQSNQGTAGSGSKQTS